MNVAIGPKLRKTRIKAPGGAPDLLSGNVAGVMKSRGRGISRIYLIVLAALLPVVIQTRASSVTGGGPRAARPALRKWQ